MNIEGKLTGVVREAVRNAGRTAPETVERTAEEVFGPSSELSLSQTARGEVVDEETQRIQAAKASSLWEGVYFEAPVKTVAGYSEAVDYCSIEGLSINPLSCRLITSRGVLAVHSPVLRDCTV